RQQAGLGEEFLRAVQSALENIAAHPIRYPVVHRETRRVLVHRFPYGILYRVYGELLSSSPACTRGAIQGDGDPRRSVPGASAIPRAGVSPQRAVRKPDQTRLEYWLDLP